MNRPLIVAIVILSVTIAISVYNMFFPRSFQSNFSSGNSNHYASKVFDVPDPTLKKSPSIGSVEHFPSGPVDPSVQSSENPEKKSTPLESFSPVAAKPEPKPKVETSPNETRKNLTVLKVSLREQIARLYINGTLHTTSPISSGNQKHQTPTGIFRIKQKKKTSESLRIGDVVDAQTGKILARNVEARDHENEPGTLFRGKSQNYFLQFSDELGIHATTEKLRSNMSHGSILLPEEKAKVFFDNIPEGTLTVIE